MLKLKIKFVLFAALCAYMLTGCTNKINQAGSSLVGIDSTLIPRVFDSDSLRIKITSSQVTGNITTGSSTELSVGSVPWTEADLLLEFYNIDSLYYATHIASAQIIFRRAPYVLPASRLQYQQSAICRI